MTISLGARVTDPHLFSPPIHRLRGTVGVVNICPAYALATGNQQPGHRVPGRCAPG